jgi:MFS family permease
LTIFLPGVNYVLLHFLRLPAHHTDLWIARGSIVLTMVSFLIMGIAAHPALLILGLLVYNLGTGYSPAMRSVSIHAAGGQSSPDIGRLFALIAIVESLGALVAGPAIAGIFDWGIRLGEPWIGAPFVASAVVLVFVTALTFAISVKDYEMLYVPVDDEHDGGLVSPVERRHQD